MGALIAGLASPAAAQPDSPQSDERALARLLAAKLDDAAGIYLVNYNSGRYLQPRRHSTANAARVVQWRYTRSKFQRWKPVLDGKYTSFENLGSHKNLGINRASGDAGANAIQAKPAGDWNQDWLMDPRPYPGESFALVNRKSGLCLGISNASIAIGGQAAQFRCDRRANQRWNFYGG